MSACLLGIAVLAALLSFALPAQSILETMNLAAVDWAYRTSIVQTYGTHGQILSTVHPDGSTIVCGSFNLALTGVLSLTAFGGGTNVYCAKINPAGAVQWTYQLGGADSVFVRFLSVEVTTDGMYVTVAISDWKTSTVTFPNSSPNPLVSPRSVIFRLNSHTGDLVYGVGLPIQNFEYVLLDSVSHDTYMYTCHGSTASSTLMFGSIPILLTNGRCIVAKIDATGLFVWAINGFGSNADWGTLDFSFDRSLLVASAIYSGAAVTIGNISLPASPTPAVYIVTLDVVTGSVQSTIRFGDSSNLADQGVGMWLDKISGVWCAISAFTSAVATYGSFIFNNTGPTGTVNSVLMTLSADFSTVLSAVQLGGSTPLYAWIIGLDTKLGGAFGMIQTQGSFQYASGTEKVNVTLPSNGDIYDFLLLFRMNSAGSLDWYTRLFLVSLSEVPFVYSFDPMSQQTWLATSYSSNITIDSTTLWNPNNGTSIFVVVVGGDGNITSIVSTGGLAVSEFITESIAFDPSPTGRVSGAVVIAGTFYGTSQFGTCGLVSAKRVDGFIAKVLTNSTAVAITPATGETPVLSSISSSTGLTAVNSSATSSVTAVTGPAGDTTGTGAGNAGNTGSGGGSTGNSGGGEINQAPSTTATTVIAGAVVLTAVVTLMMTFS